MPYLEDTSVDQNIEITDIDAEFPDIAAILELLRTGENVASNLEVRLDALLAKLDKMEAHSD